MKKIIVLFLLIPLFMGFKKPQEFDEKKMNRDLEIAKNILATLIKSGSDSFFWKPIYRSKLYQRLWCSIYNP
jgi:hypothetical protein